MRTLEVHIHTNTSCNLMCLHCYNHSGECTVDTAPPIEDIIDTIRYVCDTYDAEIHLEGGECFLRPTLLKAMDLLPDKYLQAITITTNGTIFLDDNEIVHMLKRLSALRISVESADEQQHMEIRGFSLAKTLENAMRYKHLGVPVWIRVTLNKLNYQGFFNQHILRLSEQGFSQFQVYEFQSVGRGIKNQEKLILGDSIHDLLCELENTPLSGIIIKIMLSQRRFEEVLLHKDSLETQGYRVEIIPQEEGISIHADGAAYCCAWDNEPSNLICNWYNDDDAKMMIDSINLVHNCSYCSYVRIVSSVAD